jgi:transposase
MENTAIDYQKLYEQSLLTICEKEEELTRTSLVISEKDEKIASLSFELDKFLRILFGKKSEKLSILQTGAGQLDLFELGTTQAQQEELSQQASEQKPELKKPKKRAKGSGRMVLPEDLRREVIILEPTEDVSDCKVIGQEITEVLELTPAEFYVKQYVRNKYAKANGEGIIIANLPDRVIEKGIPSETVVAQMTVDKYVYGMPLHRQIDKYTRMGIRIPASTASDWMMKGWKQLVPLWELLKLLVTNQKYLQADESPIKVLDRNHKNGIHQGYMWVYNAPSDKLVLYDYRKGRDHSGPKEMLEDYAGILQTDGYTVYEKLFASHPNIILVYCMAHARRMFIEARSDNMEKADYVLEQMQKLYALEKQMRDQKSNWQERTQLRQEKAVPILEKLEKWMDAEILQVRPTSPLGKALSYSKSRWQGLSAYTNHGQIEIDNNLVENSIRPLAIGRKNYLFAGSHKAAEMTAAMYSFMATCKKNNVNELEWLKDVFERIQSHKQKDLYQLLPNNWLEYKNSNN